MNCIKGAMLPRMTQFVSGCAARKSHIVHGDGGGGAIVEMCGTSAAAL
jgi:hypothetical protein